MEESLDFQKIGEMFVMQYYTQMHKDPGQMHKFYKESSSFVHGGSEMGCGELVTGRQAINDKILSLNLNQVHTKIRQVDSHASLTDENGTGIVIQVTGELSVDRETMRPFVQTFVLAQEAKRKFFIYNDIFRYQLYDEDLDNESEQQPQQLQQEEEIDVETNMDRPLSKEAKSPSIPDETPYYSNEQTLPGSVAELVDKRSPVPATGDSAGQSDALHGATTGRHWPAEDQPMFRGGEPPQTNGLPPEEAHVTLGEEPTYPLNIEEDENTTPNETNLEDRDDTKEEMGDQSHQPPPGTWAARISQTIGKPQHSIYNTQGIATKPLQQSSRLTNTNPLPQREPKQPIKKQIDRPPEKKPFAAPSSSSNPVTTRSAPDSHQVFVGGLPPNTTESELKDAFSHFGKIIEVRVNPKNFGFVVFDNEQQVRRVMASKEESPFTIRDKKLNIEEKRQSAPKGGFGVGAPSLGRNKAPLRPTNRPQRRS